MWMTLFFHSLFFIALLRVNTHIEQHIEKWMIGASTSNERKEKEKKYYNSCVFCEHTFDFMTFKSSVVDWEKVNTALEYT